MYIYNSLIRVGIKSGGVQPSRIVFGMGDRICISVCNTFYQYI